MMKTISLWQPWASLWLTDAKVHETRHWPTNHRGPLLVHASKRLVSACGAAVDEICIRRFGPMWRKELPTGAVIGAVNLEACVPTESAYGEVAEVCDDLTCGNFSPGRYAWRRGPRPLPFGTPVLWTGRQGLFNVDSEAIEEYVKAHFSKELAA